MCPRRPIGGPRALPFFCSSPARIACTGAGTPVISSNCRNAWCSSMSRPVTVTRPGTGGGQRGRPRVVEDVEQRRHRRQTARPASPRRRPARWTPPDRRRRPPLADHVQSQPIARIGKPSTPASSTTAGGALRPAAGDDQPSRPPLGQGGDHRRGRSAAAEDQRRPRAGSRRPPAAHRSTRPHRCSRPASRRSRRTRVFATPSASTRAAVRRPSRRRRLAGHRHREPGPLRAEPATSAGQRGRVALDPLVRPAGQPGRGDNRPGAAPGDSECADRRSEHRGPVRVARPVAGVSRRHRSPLPARRTPRARSIGDAETRLALEFALTKNSHDHPRPGRARRRPRPVPARRSASAAGPSACRCCTGSGSPGPPRWWRSSARSRA